MSLLSHAVLSPPLSPLFLQIYSRFLSYLFWGSHPSVKSRHVLLPRVCHVSIDYRVFKLCSSALPLTTPLRISAENFLFSGHVKFNIGPRHSHQAALQAR